MEDVDFELSDAKVAQAFAINLLHPTHRGVIECEKGVTYVIFGNERRSDYARKLLAHPYVAGCRKAFYDAAADGGSGWAIVVRDYESRDLDYTILHNMIWDAWKLALTPVTAE